MNTVKLTLQELDKIIESEMDKFLLEEQKNRDNYNITVEKIDGTVQNYRDTEESKSFERNKRRLEAINGFKLYYRSLDTDQRYEVTKWLKSKLLDELNLREIEEITSRVVSAGNGLARRKDPLRKPK